MNRVLGDYFETLLYKIFVSIDEHTTVAKVRQFNDTGYTLPCSYIIQYTCNVHMIIKSGDIMVYLC